jgi:predicted dehydrogenase
MNRREFSKLSVLSLASARVPAYARGNAAESPIGYAAIGLGTISDIFIRACAGSKTAKITALVTGDPLGKGAVYAAKYGIPKSSVYSYETFDRIRDNKDVDAIYIGLPNSMHCEYTLRGAKAGKHVFCEKPMAISSAECHTMIDACRAAKVKLMIGYRIQYEPMWNKAIGIIKNGGIGVVQSFQGGFFNTQPAGVWRLNKKLGGGGPLMDLGIYPLNAIRHITGEEPTDFTAVASTRDKSGRFAEVEQSLEWTMKFPSGIIASCGCSYAQSGPGFLNINGDTGSLQMMPGFFYDGVQMHGTAEGQLVDERSPGKAPYQFTLEAEHFAACIRNNVEPRTPGEEGLKDLIAIEGIYRSAGTPIA